MLKFSQLSKIACLALFVCLPSLASAYEFWNDSIYHITVSGTHLFSHALDPKQHAPCSPSNSDCYGPIQFKATVWKKAGEKVMSTCSFYTKIPAQETGHYFSLKTSEGQCYIQSCRDNYGCSNS